MAFEEDLLHNTQGFESHISRITRQLLQKKILQRLALLHRLEADFCAPPHSVPLPPLASAHTVDLIVQEPWCSNLIIHRGLINDRLDR